MTDKQKIREELTRRIKERLSWIKENSHDQRIALLEVLNQEDESMLRYIDSLPEEPASEDLEEAAKKAATFYSHISGDKFIPNDYWLFKKGAQWQKQQMIDKACKLVVNCVEDFMLRRMEIWDEESKQATLKNIRKAMEE